MNTIRIFNLLFGTVSFEISGASPESFLNGVMNENLFVWRLEKRDAGTLRATCRAAHFEQMKKIAQACACDVTEISRNGLPVFLRRYKARYGLCAGAVLFLAVLAVLSSFIWSVEIVGASSFVQEEEIRSLLAENGLKVGVPIGSVDGQEIKMRVLSETDTISYLTVSVTGTKAVVEIERITPPPPVSSRFLPCNLVAAEDGVVVSVRSYNGPAYVKKGDVVTKGQLLVGGVYDSKVLGYRVVHASGVVMAETWQTFSQTVTYDEMTREYSGEETSVRFVELFGNRLYLSFRPQSPYESFTSTETSDDVCIRGAVLPFSVGRITYYETVRGAVTPDAEAMATVCRERLNETVRIALAGQTVTSREETVVVDENGVTVTQDYAVIRNIAKEQEILE